MRRVAGVFAAVVALQVAYPVAIVAWNEIELARGYEVRLQTAPIDPRDLFRGDYVTLGYEISSVYTEAKPGETVYVRLRKVGPRWMANYADPDKPDAMPFIRGRVVGNAGQGERQIDYGIERYYVQEGTGRRYERAPFLYVDVKLDRNGKARIDDVRIPRAAR